MNCLTAPKPWKVEQMKTYTGSAALPVEKADIPPMDEDLPRIVDFLDLFATQAQISNEDPVIVIGDCAMDVTLRMSFQTFRNHLKLMIELPQYTYVLAKDFQWCFCYTFEDDMYFGKAQQKKKKMEKGLGTKGTGTDVNRG